MEKGARKEGASPAKKVGPKWDEDRHPRARSRTGDREKARDKDWDHKGQCFL